jgi:hypothetical protein
MRKIGIIMNGVTGRMGANQHLGRSIAAIRKQGGIQLSDQSTAVLRKKADVLAAELEPRAYDVWHDRAVFHPQKCSGLEVMGYDADSLHDQFGVRFRLVESSQELHATPQGATQQFLYCYCRLEQKDKP